MAQGGETMKHLILAVYITGMMCGVALALRQSPMIPKPIWMQSQTTDPALAECDESIEYKRQVMQTTTNELWICYPTGWYSVALAAE